jgi:hypothetical protein
MTVPPRPAKIAVVLALMTAFFAAGGPGYDVGRAFGHLLGALFIWLVLFNVVFWVKEKIWPQQEEVA